jgi:hypothetical protein
MDAAKIRLSKEEMTLVTDPEWILTKNSIILKVVELLARLSDDWRGLWELRKGYFPPELQTASPRISKGENYKGLPYVVLDFPRAFGREDIFAIRTLFWWGHYFSMTLHLRGRYKQLFLPVIREHVQRLALAGFHIGGSEDEWRHEHDPVSDEEEMEAILAGRSFLKLSATCGLDRWEEAPDRLGQMFRELLETLA